MKGSHTNLSGSLKGLLNLQAAPSPTQCPESPPLMSPSPGSMLTSFHAQDPVGEGQPHNAGPGPPSAPASALPASLPPDTGPSRPHDDRLGLSRGPIGSFSPDGGHGKGSPCLLPVGHLEAQEQQQVWALPLSQSPPLSSPPEHQTPWWETPELGFTPKFSTTEKGNDRE